MNATEVRKAIQRARCSTCGVNAGTPCRSLYVTHLGEVRTTPVDYYVHAARRDAAAMSVNIEEEPMNDESPESKMASDLEAAFEVLTDRESRDWKSIDEAAALLRRITRGAATLGRIVAAQNRDALAAIGNPPDLIDEDGDGDWAVVWERLAELRPTIEAQAAYIDRLESHMTRSADLAVVVTERLDEQVDAQAAEIARLRAALGETR